MSLKCLSMVQPWASLVVHGCKSLETRSWATRHRGLLAIHACRKIPEPVRGLCQEEPFRSILLRLGYKSWLDLPTSAVLGTVQLVDCRPMVEIARLRAEEETLGDFRPGRWAWVFTQPTAFANPVPFIGKLGVFEISDGALARTE